MPRNFIALSLALLLGLPSFVLAAHRVDTAPAPRAPALPHIDPIPSFGPVKPSAGDIRAESTEKCVNAYYGIGEPIDYAKAFKCFEAEHIYQYLITMQLNGEGTPPDLKKAKELMAEWLDADPDNAGSMDETEMEKLLNTRSENPKASNRKIDYCNDVSSTTYSMDFCAGVQDHLKRQDTDKAFADIRRKLEPRQQAIWDRVLEAFQRYLDAEGNRGYQMYAGGSAAGSASTSHRTFVRENFQSFMQVVFGKLELQPSSKADLAKAEMDLKTAYDADIGGYEESYTPPAATSAESSDDKEFRETMTQYVAEYKDDAALSQQHWITLRDLCADLAADVYKGKNPGVDWSVSFDTAFSIARIRDIREHPLGGD